MRSRPPARPRSSRTPSSRPSASWHSLLEPLHQRGDRLALRRRQIRLLALPEDGHELRDASPGEIEVVHPDASSLTASDGTVPYPDLPGATRALYEVAGLGVGHDALLERHHVVVRQLSRPLEPMPICAEAADSTILDHLTTLILILLSGSVASLGLVHGMRGDARRVEPAPRRARLPGVRVHPLPRWARPACWHRVRPGNRGGALDKEAFALPGRRARGRWCAPCFAWARSRRPCARRGSPGR